MRPTNFPECGNACYTAFEVLPGVFHIRSNYGDLVFMTLLIGTERALLIDTGFGYGDLAGFIRTLTDLPLTVVCSHGHVDHNGGNWQFPEVWQSHLDLGVTDWSRCDESNDNVIDFAPAPEHGGFDAEAFLRYDPATTLPLEDGQIFDLGGATVRTILVGNHSPGSCVFFCPERRFLVGGDSIGPAISLANPESCSVEKHLTLLRELRELPFDTLVSGHSERLVPKAEVQCYIDVAEHLDEAVHCSYRSTILPSYRNRMYLYSNEQGDTGVLILPLPKGAKR